MREPTKGELMQNYAEARREDVLDTVNRVQNQIEMNQIWIANGNPSRFNSEGRVV